MIDKCSSVLWVRVRVRVRVTANEVNPRNMHDHIRYDVMEKNWRNQASTASMNKDGSYRNCSNVCDSTGYYTYRKDGNHTGECWGMDFEQARRRYDGHGPCQKDSKLCMDSGVHA